MSHTDSYSHRYKYLYRTRFEFPYASYPAVRLLLLFCGGIILSSFTRFPTPAWAALFFATMTCFVLFHYGSGRILRTEYYQISIAAYLLSVLLFGAGWHAMQGLNEKSGATRLLEAFAGEQALFTGMVTQTKYASSGSGSLLIDIAVDHTRLEGAGTWSESYTLRAIAHQGAGPTLHAVSAGDRVRFVGTIYAMPTIRNPHEFDYASYLRSAGISGQAGIDSLLHTDSARVSADGWLALRLEATKRIDMLFSDRAAPLAKALLLGNKNDLEQEDKRAFSRVGLSHIMAVSGLHVGFVLAPVWIIIPWFWAFRAGRMVALTLILLLLLFYAGLTGFSPSVMRASLTGGLIMFGRLFNRGRDVINLTALAALIILLLNPSALFDISFQLSFSAVFIILLCLPALKAFLPPAIRYRWYASPVMLVVVSLLVQVGLYPLLAYYFGEFSLVGPVANALVIPLLTLLVPLGLIIIPLSVSAPGLAGMVVIPFDHALTTLHDFVMLASTWEASWLPAPLPEPMLFIIWISAVALVCSMTIPRIRWKALAVFLSVLTVHQALTAVKNTGMPELEITVFDVRQGDAILVKTPSGKHFMIDTGRWSPGQNSARHPILPHLQREGIGRLEAIILSHPHADHIGGVTELIDSIPIHRIYDSGHNYNTQLYQNYRFKASNRGIPIHTARAGDIIPIDPAIRLFVYGPADLRGSASNPNPNDYSVVFELIYGKTEFLFMGDAGHVQEQRLLEHYGPLLKTDFLKVGHHGSRTSSSSRFLEAAAPRHAVVSLSKRNRYHHPHPEAVKRLRSSTANLYFTSLEGALQFRSDGHRILRHRWQNWR